MAEYFQGIKVGDRVWSVVYGWGEVKVIYKDDRALSVSFPDGDSDYFYLSGVCNNGELQTLFWDEVKITPPPKPKRMVRREAVVTVTNISSQVFDGVYYVSGDKLPTKAILAKLTWEEEE